MEQVFCKQCDSEKNYDEVKKNLNLCPDCNADLSAGLKSSPTPKTKTTSTKKKNESKIIDVSSAQSHNANEVIITDVKMKFGSMIMFMVKWVIASIPAFIILFLIGFVVMAIFGIGAVSLFN